MQSGHAALLAGRYGTFHSAIVEFMLKDVRELADTRKQIDQRLLPGQQRRFGMHIGGFCLRSTHIQQRAAHMDVRRAGHWAEGPVERIAYSSK